MATGQKRRTSVVTFYNPEDGDVLGRPGESSDDSEDANDDERKTVTKKSPSPRLALLKTTESEDSGVKSASAESDDVRYVKPKFQIGRLPRTTSYQSSASSRRSSITPPLSLTSPVFDFPSFDELFNSHGKTTLTLHKPEWRCTDAPPPIRSARTSFAVSIQKAYEEQERAGRKPLKRVDSIMAQSMSDLVYQSWESSRSFVGFRNKVGRYFYHKNCAWNQMDSMPFVFTHVLVGMYLVSVGVLGLINCMEEYIINLYAIVNGLLCVFLFPTLILTWSKRVGGCVNESEKDQMGKGLFWAVTLVVRIMTSAGGTFLLWHRYTYYDVAQSSWMCELTFYSCVYCVIGEWAFLFFLFVLPTLVFCIIRCVAPRIV